MPDNPKPLTGPQIKALRYLATVQYAVPSDIGQAMGRDQASNRVSAGWVAHRLIKLHLVVDMSRVRGGFPAYAITHEGRTHPTRNR
jgi:hypothetical protein